LNGNKWPQKYNSSGKYRNTQVNYHLQIIEAVRTSRQVGQWTRRNRLVQSTSRCALVRPWDSWSPLV